jgi:hypothetical protein
VTTAALEQFAADPAKGPKLDNLHFDVKAGLRSEWNKKALQLMSAEFRKELEEDYENVPVRSPQYIEELIRERFRRLVNVWKRAQPQMTPSGELESHQAIEQRMMEDKDIELKTCRHITRRINVRWVLKKKETITDVFCRNITVGSKQWNV